MNNLINKKAPIIWHGCDYNPDQWLHMPEVIDQDFDLMVKANCDVFSLGIFAWAKHEPEEGVFDFDWLQDILDRLHKIGKFAIIATPSGGRPRWLAQKYPEVLRVQENRVRDLYGQRHNHCYTSPIMREKVSIINRKLAEKFGNHPALVGWHISNEINGECYCPKCCDAFREWLKEKYNGDLDKLNQNYWSAFWSHTYTDWSQIEPFCHHGDNDVIHGINIDFNRFVSHQTAEFFRIECEPLKEISPDVPITTNLMGYHPESLEKRMIANQCDFTSWDSYPMWHDKKCGNELHWGKEVAFDADYTRSLSKNGNFIQMEATPSNTNWQGLAKHKRPGVHHLASMQTLAQGADGVLYFQWRACRGGNEKFHGTVVGHDSSEEARVFKDVSALGGRFKALQSIVGSKVKPKVAIIIDAVSRWAITGTQGFSLDNKDYVKICQEWHSVLWEMGVTSDQRESDEDLSSYDLVIAPMLYALRDETPDNLKSYVKNGGTLVGTAITGYADENDLCYMGGFPGPLRELYGLWIEELDTLWEHDENSLVPEKNNILGLEKSYKLKTYCERIHPETATVVAKYADDFYADEAVLTNNKYGKGSVWYIASKPTDEFKIDFLKKLIAELNIPVALPEQEKGIVANRRYKEDKEFLFIMNYNDKETTAVLDDKKYRCLEKGTILEKSILMSPYEVKILEYSQSNR